MAGPARRPPAPPDYAELVKNAAGAILGLAAFVYISGGAVLWARLRGSDLPADTVVTVLPRELLVATGLRNVVAPSLVLALVALVGFLWFLLIRRRFPGGWVPRWVMFVIMFGAAVYVVGAGVLFYGTFLFGWAIAILLAYFSGALIPGVMRFEAKPGAAVAAVLLVIGLLGASVRFVLEYRKPLLDQTVVCVNDGGRPYRGLLIGETSEAVYVGQQARERVLAVPRSRVGELWIGNSGDTCSVPRPSPG